MRGPLCCEMCARLKGSSYDAKQDLDTYYCEAYPKGIPEAVFWAGHVYPKPGDHGLQFKSIDETDPFYNVKHSQEEEDGNYRGYAEFYEELNMTNEEFMEKMKRDHGKDWYLYRKPTRDDIGEDGIIMYEPN